MSEKKFDDDVLPPFFNDELPPSPYVQAAILKCAVLIVKSHIDRMTALGETAP